MPKHNKKRNTAFLYETLVREVVKQTITKDFDKRDKAITILKEHFTKREILGKELDLYKTLSRSQKMNPLPAEKLIQEAKKEYRKLDSKEIFNEQSAVINKINKTLSNGVYSNFVPNYKDLATLSQIFGDDVSAKSRVLLEEHVLRKLTSSRDMLKEERETKVSKLVVKTFVNKFNQQYAGELLEEQKALLNKYVMSFINNGVEFKFHLNEELGRLREKLDESLKIEEIKNDKQMADKMKMIISYLEGAGKKPINRESLQQILKIQTLIQEIFGNEY
jgi:hypothetical protein